MRRHQAIALLVSEMQQQTEGIRGDSALAFVRLLRPVSWKWDTRDGSDPHGAEANGSWDIGFLAQDLQEAQRSSGLELGIVDDQDPDHLRIRPEKLIPVMLQALREIDLERKEIERTP